MDDAWQTLIKTSQCQLPLTAQVYDRALKLSRAINDLAG